MNFILGFVDLDRAVRSTSRVGGLLAEGRPHPCQVAIPVMVSHG